MVEGLRWGFDTDSDTDFDGVEGCRSKNCLGSLRHFVGIAIGIGIDGRSRIHCILFPDAITSSAQPAEHGCDAIEFLFSGLTLPLVQRLSDHQNVLNRGAFKCRTTCDFKIAPPIRFGGFPITFGDVQRDRLTCAKPLIAGWTVDAEQGVGLLIDPCDIANGKR